MKSKSPGTTCARVALALLVGSSCWSLAGCRTIEGTWGVPPFFEVYDTPSSVGSEAGHEYFFRPLGSYEDLESSSTAKTQAPSPPPGAGSHIRATGHHVRFISPFLDFHWGPDGHRYSVLPLFYYRSYPQPQSGEDIDWMLFPFFYGGTDPDEGSYFAFFPLGGKLKGILGQDEIDFWLFPLWWHSRDRERHSLHVVWPFYNRVWGENAWHGEESGWRLWPFHGSYRSTGADGRLRSAQSFTAWPFYIHRQDQMNLNPTEVFFSLPFYGERINARTETYVYLWPFFQTHYDRKYDRKTYLGFLIPYRFTDGQSDLWPLFGFKRTSRGTDLGGVARRNYRHFFIWPFERYEWATDGLEETTRFWLLPLLWHFHYIDKDTLEIESEWTLWPLLRKRSVGESDSFDLLSPLWFRREDYDRLYSRWFNIFRYRSKPEISGVEILYGALQYRVEPPKNDALFSILGGLFEVGKRNGSASLRILYLPWVSPWS